MQIYRYVTEGAFNSYLYQMAENKQRFILQVFTSKSPVRVMREIDDAVQSYNEIEALATGNPMIIDQRIPRGFERAAYSYRFPWR